MAVTSEDMRRRFPELQPAPIELIEGAIADAELLVDRALFRHRADAAVRFLAAHMIANNPLGEMARLEKEKDKDGRTTYLDDFERLKRTVVSGFRVA